MAGQNGSAAIFGCDDAALADRRSLSVKERKIIIDQRVTAAQQRPAKERELPEAADCSNLARTDVQPAGVCVQNVACVDDSQT